MIKNFIGPDPEKDPSAAPVAAAGVDLSEADQYRIDYAYPDPGKYESLKCGICETEMNVRRNLHGPTSYGAAMAKKGRDHDAFRCPHIDEDWHIQAKALRRAARETPSATLAGVFLQEMAQICQTREATKKVSKF